MAGQVVDNGRNCGECRLCCKAMGVAELSKPPGVWCVHAGDHAGGGCAIYQDRPAGCREFNCAWLTDMQGLFEDSDRPDRIGVVFWVSRGAGVTAAGKSLDVLVAMESHKGSALQGSRSREIIETLRRKGVPISISFGGLIAPVNLTREGRIMLDADRAVPTSSGGGPPGA